MGKKLIFFLLVIFLIGMVVYSNPQEKTEEVDINVEQALELIEKHAEEERFLLLDVRTPGEFDEGHLKGAINLDFYSEDFRDRLAELDPEYTYLVYCRSGNRSAMTVSIMEEMGINRAYNLLGGIIAWEAEGHCIIQTETKK